MIALAVPFPVGAKTMPHPLVDGAVIVVSPDAPAFTILPNGRMEQITCKS